MLPHYDITKPFVKTPDQKRNKLNESGNHDDDNSSRKEDMVPAKKQKRLTSRESDEIDQSFSSNSKSSVLSDENKRNTSINLTYFSDFDKLMEGYGTEEEDLGGDLNVELRSKITGGYETDSEEGDCSPSDSLSNKKNDLNNGEDEDLDKSSVSSSDASVLNRNAVRTRGGYHNVSGKIKIIVGKKPDEQENGQKRSLETSPDNPAKYARRDSEDSIKAQSGKISESDKINKLDLSDDLEFTIGTGPEDRSRNTSEKLNDVIARSELVLAIERNGQDKIKPVNTEQLNSNKDLRISPSIKIESMADRLIKKMNLTPKDGENIEVDSVRKQIFDKLEATSTSNTEKSECQKKDAEKNEAPNKNNQEEKEEHDHNPEKNVTETAPADSQNKMLGDEESEEDYLHLTTVKKCYSSASNNSKPNNKTNKSESTEIQTQENTGHKQLLTIKKLEKIQEISQKSSDMVQKEISFKKIDLKSIDVINRKSENKQTVSSSNEGYSSSESSEHETSEAESEKEETTVRKIGTHNNYLKIVNVNDIMSGKSSDVSITKKITEVKRTEQHTNSDFNILQDCVEIKSEPLSDSEESNEVDKLRTQAMKIPPLSLIEKDKKKNKVEKPGPFKIVDNLTRIIDSVATNSIGLNSNEISLHSIQSPKQKARKSFPSVITKPLQTIQIKKITQEKKDTAETSPKPQQTVQVKSTQSSVKSTQQSAVVTTTLTTINKDNLVYITQPHQNQVVLPPNQPISVSQNVANPILAMVQHPSISNTGLLLQQNPTPTIQLPTVSTCTTTPSLDSVSTTQTATPSVDILAEDVCKTVGDMLCKPPPKLKPKPPGPLSTYFDEGNPSSAGPVTKSINSVAHRLSDYFRGLLIETLSDLTTAGSSEAKIRSLELEIENLKHKHNEEMLEFRKNISTILKDIQKSIVEERNKIIDETRANCEAERLRSVEEAKSKQWYVSVSPSSVYYN